MHSEIDDPEVLKRLNERINDAENRGDRDFLAGILAPKLAFQRANPEKTVDNASAFLLKAMPGGERRIRILDPIQLFGNRAIVECVVTQGECDYHNLRMFVRRDDGWKLIAWANEPL